MFITIVTSVVLGLVILLLYYDWKFRECMRALPGLPALPLLGNTLQIGSSPSDLLNFIIKSGSLGPMARAKFGPYLFVHLTGPNEVETVVTDQHLINKAHEYDLLKDWLGDGLLLSNGDKWRRRRKLLTPAFHFNILQQIVPTLEKQINTLIEKFESTMPHPVDVYPTVTLCTLDIIAETAMGVELNCQSNPDSEYVKAVKGISMIVRHRLLSLLKRFDCIFKLTPTYKDYKRYLNTLHDFTRDIIKERRQILEKEMKNDNFLVKNEESLGIKKRYSFLDTLILSDTGEGKLSDEEIREEVDTFMFEGHDTTASAVSFILYCVAQNHEIQEKIYQEQVEIFGDDPEKEITFERLNKMRYTEMAVKESLRLYPSVPVVMRQVPADMKMNGISLAKGVSLVINIICQNRNPTVFKDPLKFIPERFSTENSLDRHPFSYIPFSAGSRNCIGQKFAMMELKAVLSKVVRKFILSPGSDEPPELALDLVLRSINGINLKFQKRQIL